MVRWNELKDELRRSGDRLHELAKRQEEINKAADKGSLLGKIAIGIALVFAYGGIWLLLHYLGVFNSPLANAVFDTP
jgi:hypothetical protein